MENVPFETWAAICPKSYNFLKLCVLVSVQNISVTILLVWKYCRSDHIKIISLVIPSSTIDSCRPDNQKLPSKLAPSLMGNRKPLTFGRLQGISIRYLTTDAALPIHIVFACCVVWHLGLDEAVSPLQFFPNCVRLSKFWSSRHKAESCDLGCLPTSEAGTV